MVQDIYDPLNDYVNIYKGRFKEVSESTFDELAGEAKVDVEANRNTCKELYATEEELDQIKSRISGFTTLCVFLWLGVAGAIASIFLIEGITTEAIVGISAAVVGVLLILLLAVHPKLKSLKNSRADLEGKVAELTSLAWEQMKPLNDLYDWDLLARMMSKTVPRLEFDPYFTTQRLADLQATYGWDGSFNDERSVIYSHSGLINGNPFVLCRTRKMEMGSMTYHGYKTIHWTSRDRNSDGSYRTVHHSQTLHATYTAPYPLYFEKTRLIYANVAAPDLVFYRKQSDLAGKEKSIAFKWKEFRLRKKSRNLKGGDYAMLTNDVFEVAFDTSNRNNNQQFALLFTPLAQENMLALLRDEEIGFGDDFDFEKNKMVNVIISDHMQGLELDMDPRRYLHFDYDKARLNFYTVNQKYFHAIYFSFAPLLCVPMYQQIRSQEDIYGHDMLKGSSFWEHEALANFWGQDRFKHPSCVTDCILKTEHGAKTADGSSQVTVYAHGYCAEPRVAHISMYGNDGRWHDVPVKWDEYLPVTGTGAILIKEDNESDANMTHKERLSHIDNVLSSYGMSIYRRHIASRA